MNKLDRLVLTGAAVVAAVGMTAGCMGTESAVATTTAPSVTTEAAPTPTATPTATLATADVQPVASSTQAPTVAPTATGTVTEVRRVRQPWPPGSHPLPLTPSPQSVLATILPYYGQPAPAWCEEDMPCWIGSEADGRSDAQIVKDMACDLMLSSYAYSSTDEGLDPADFARCDGEG